MTRGATATRRAAACLAVAAVLASGCGYRLVRYEGALGDARSVAVGGLRNDTREPGLDALVTEALRSEFLRRGALRLVDDPETADLVIDGSVAGLDTRLLSSSSVQFVVEYEVRLALALDVQRRDGSPIPLDAASLWETELYLASADIEVLRKNRLEALRRLSVLLAGRVHEALFESLAP